MQNLNDYVIIDVAIQTLNLAIPTLFLLHMSVLARFVILKQYILLVLFDYPSLVSYFLFSFLSVFCFVLLS